jgi:ketosteroid isomerase-like protein
MTRCLPIAIVALLVAASRLGAQSVTDSIRALDSAFARSYAVHDTVTAKALFATDVLITGANGAIKSKEQELNDVRPAPGLAMRYFRTQNVDVHVHGSTATVIGEAQWEFTMGGNARNVSRRYTATYARGGPLGWQIVALHLFAMPPGWHFTVSTPRAGMDRSRTVVSARRHSFTRLTTAVASGVPR